MTVDMQQFSANPLHYLNILIRNQPRNDIKSRAALLFELTNGDRSAADMLDGIISWTKYSVLNGWIYKTAKDWWNEFRITLDQRNRVHQSGILAKLGIERKRRQVARNGTPMHYRIGWNSLLAAIANLYQTTIKQILDWMALPDNAKSADVENQNPDFGKSQEQNNSTNNLNQQDNVVVKKESPIPGIKLEVAQVLLQKFGEERVQQVVAYAKRKKAKNMGGFIRKALEENWEIPLVQVEKESSAKEKETRRDFTSGKYADFINQDDEFTPHFGTIPANEDDRTYDNPILDNGMSAADAWEAGYNQLELQLDRASFDTWLKSAQFMGVDAGVFVVQVHNQYAQEMLQGRLYRNIRCIVGDIAGMPKNTLELRFESKVVVVADKKSNH